jgi:hypothetical protein
MLDAFIPLFCGAVLKRSKTIKAKLFDKKDLGYF